MRILDSFVQAKYAEVGKTDWAESLRREEQLSPFICLKEKPLLRCPLAITTGQRCPSRSVELSSTNGVLVGEAELIFHSEEVKFLLEFVPGNDDLVNSLTFLVELSERWLVS